MQGLDEFLSDVSGLSNGSHLVITTRAIPAVLDPPVACARIPVMEESMEATLKGLEDQDAIALLREMGVQGESAALLQTAREYGNHPLALEVLAGTLTKREGGLIERAPRINVHHPKQRLFKLLESAESCIATESASIKLLAFSACFLEDPPLSALEHLFERMRYGGAMSRFIRDLSGSSKLQELQETAISLADWNLLKWDGERKTISLHPLIKEHFSLNG